MLTDGRSVERDTRFNTDVCIIGAGAAGITLARELAPRGFSIALVESGGFEDHPTTADLYRGENVGRHYFPLHTCRQRFFGGTTNHWLGYTRPLDPLDLGARPWIPESGWPLRFHELAAYYPQAHRLLELKSMRYDADFWRRSIGADVLPLDPKVVESVVFQLSTPTRFGVTYREALEQSPNVNVMLHSNAISIDTAESGGQVTGVRIATLGGGTFSVMARAYILAAGGIENPRILLSSVSPAHPQGLGNRHDAVGRYFMDHPHLARALFLPSSSAMDAAFYNSYRGEMGGFMGALRLRPAVLRHERLNNLIVTLVEVRRVDERLAEAMNSPGAVAYEHLARYLERGEWPDEFSRDVWRVIRDIDDVAIAHTGLRRSHGAEGRMYRVFFRTEQVPNRDSRVTLGDETDALGMRRPRLDWQLSDADYHTLVRGHQIFAAQFGLARLGRFFFPGPTSDRAWLEDVIGGYHHMGTTRMHEDPDHGVVDADCRVHDIANLYIAGSSVFPTVGCANPTLTLVALALRLSGHLAKTLKR